MSEATGRAAKVACKVPVAPPDGAELLTVPEAAWVLRSSVDTVYRLLARGEMEGTRVATKRFVSRAAVARYLDRQTTAHRPEAAHAALPVSVGLKEAGLWSGKDY